MLLKYTTLQKLGASKMFKKKTIIQQGCVKLTKVAVNDLVMLQKDFNVK